LNKDISRKIIAIAYSSKNRESGLTMQEITNAISFKRGLLSPDVLEKFIDMSVKEGLLVQKDKLYLPNFSTSGIIVPLDFSVDTEELFSEYPDRPVVDRMLDAITASGKMTKKDAISISKDLTNSMKYIDFEIALLAVMSDNSIENSSFLKEVMEKRGLKFKN
jgi:hypothetical protein